MSAAASCPVVVVGNGPAGLAAGLALAASGIEVAIAGPPPRVRPSPTPPCQGEVCSRDGEGSSARRGEGIPPDTRTAALFLGSIALLRNLGVWEAVAPASAPLAAIRIVDDTERLLRAPQVLFAAGDIGEDAFGYNIPNAALTAALHDAAAADPQIGRASCRERV
jgi:2-octaprenyl-6-methoxyphenol hydroxylase